MANPFARLFGKGKGTVTPVPAAPPAGPGAGYPRQCPNSNHYVPAGHGFCPHCGYKMPPPGHTLPDLR
jgi:hypothetical protein